MKQTLKTIGFTGALLAGALLTQSTAFAQPGADNALQNRIVGLWDVQITVDPDCDIETPNLPLRGLHQFALGGTGQVVPSTSPQLLSPHMMVWKHLGGDNYEWTAKFFRFGNPPSSPQIFVSGYAILRGTVNISGDNYVGTGHSFFYDALSTPITDPDTTGCIIFDGERFREQDVPVPEDS